MNFTEILTLIHGSKMGELNKNKVDVHNNVFLIATRFYVNSYYFPK